MPHNGFVDTRKLNQWKSDIPTVTRSRNLTIDTDDLDITMQKYLFNGKDKRHVIAVCAKRKLI